jgi:hypothetical protein
MTNLGDLVAELQAAKKRVAEAIELAVAARTEIEAAERQFSRTVQGSSRPEARATPERWGAANERLDKMIGRLLAGSYAVDVYIDVLGGGEGGTASIGEASTAGSTDIPEPTERGSRLARLRRELVRHGDDVVDSTHDTTDAIRNLVPHGHGPTTAHTASPATPPADQAPGVPDYATGFAAGGILAAEGVAKVVQALRRLKEKHDKQNS